MGLSGCANLCTSPSRGTLHRCIQPGLGRTQGPPVSSRPLASSSLRLSRHPARSGGSLPGASAVFLALQQFLSSAQGRHALLNTDNTTVACHITGGGLGGEGGGGAGALSSPSPSLECMVSPSSASVCSYVQPQTSNLRSSVPVPTAWAVDTLSIPWSSLLAYAFPPLPILSQVLYKAREDQATLILIAPSGQLNPDAQSCSVSPVYALLLLSSGIAHASPGLLSLHAWLLWALVFVRGLAGRRGHGLPGPSFWLSRARPIVLAVKGQAHRSGCQGDYSSHWFRWLRWSQDDQVDPCYPSCVQVANFWCSSPRPFFLSVFI